MQTHEHAVDIAATPEAVFDWLTDPQRLSQWLGGFVSSEPLAGAHNEPGAKARIVIDENGRMRVMTSEVLEVIPHRRLVVAVNGEGVVTTSTYAIEPCAAGVRLTHRMEAEFSGMLGLLAPFFRDVVSRKMRADLARLKRSAEGASRAA
jgi:uncharacterized protein YndB with AHSA1/START domain